ncbi:MAG: 1-acyl-sn-glycerol-3-phosphate acyltransferase [Gammaproteobacteria bacterium]|nr:1-acyl-sn-glycerol-3-phosphate acyltransferase [Gammaproteobacteria bacterium]
MLWARSLLFMLGMTVSAVIFAPLALLTFPLPLKQRFRFISLWARLNIWWLGITCRLYFRVEGREHIPPGPAIVLCKHQSAWETLVLQQLLPPQVWLLKRELLWLPFFGWGLAMTRPIAIDRKAGRRAIEQLLEQGRQRLDDGMWVIIYPEGTRTAPGGKGRYAPGGALLAEHSAYPVLPVAHNAGEFWRRRGFIKYPGIITLVFGPVIDSAGRKAGDINSQAEQWIEMQMARITTRPELYSHNATPAG